MSTNFESSAGHPCPFLPHDKGLYRGCINWKFRTAFGWLSSGAKDSARSLTQACCKPRRSFARVVCLRAHQFGPRSQAVPMHQRPWFAAQMSLKAQLASESVLAPASIPPASQGRQESRTHAGRGEAGQGGWGGAVARQFCSAQACCGSGRVSKPFLSC